MYNGKDYIIETEPLYPYLKSKQISFIALHIIQPVGEGIWVIGLLRMINFIW